MPRTKSDEIGLILLFLIVIAIVDVNYALVIAAVFGGIWLFIYISDIILDFWNKHRK